MNELDCTERVIKGKIVVLIVYGVIEVLIVGSLCCLFARDILGAALIITLVWANNTVKRKFVECKNLLRHFINAEQQRTIAEIESMLK